MNVIKKKKFALRIESAVTINQSVVWLTYMMYKFEDTQKHSEEKKINHDKDIFNPELPFVMGNSDIAYVIITSLGAMF